MKVIYIAGSGHCGSTLLDMILGNHSAIFGMGEIHNIRFDNKCSCGELLQNCRYWKNLNGKINPKDLAIFRTKKDFLLNTDNYCDFTDNSIIDIEKYLNINKVIFDNIIEKSGKQIIVDSSKDVDRLELLLKDKNLDVTIVHIVRDGRAVLWSYFKKYKKVLPYAFKWFLTNLKIEIVKNRNDIKYIFINYEKFVQNPKKEVEKILDTVGLDYEEEILDFRKFEHHQVAGNRMRKGGSGEIKIDDEWKEKIPLRHKFIFNILFGWANILYILKK